MAEFRKHVLLVGNYVLDQQESMQRFAAVMFEELTKRDASVELIRPEPAMGRLLNSKWARYWDKLVIFPGRLRRRIRSFKAGDVLHICDHSNAVYTNAAANIPHLVTCHDLLAIRSARGEFPERPTARAGRIYQRMILKGLNHARRVACVSRKTMEDAQRLTTLNPEQLSLVYNGLNYSYAPIDRIEARTIIAKRRGEPPTRFLLHVGGNQWYKNRLGVMKIYRELLRLMPSAPELVMVGKEWTPEMRAMTATNDLKGKVHPALDCSNEELRAFYSAAELLVFPSLHEGFGWPIIEAHACGCRVAASNRAPMTEVGGDAANYFDPSDPPVAARAIHTLLVESPTARAARVARGIANAARFSASRMIDQYLEQYRALTT